MVVLFSALDDKLKWNDHISHIVEKALRRLNVISRYRLILPRSVLVNLYITMVRPVLEYCDVVYDNCPTYLKQSLENVQRKGALICTGAYRHTEHKLLLQELSWQSLMERRRVHKLSLFYKIYHNLYPTYLKSLLPPINDARYNLRDRSEFKIPICRLNMTFKSFFPSTSKVWNTLPPPVKNAESIVSFKCLIAGARKKQNKYYTACSGKKGIWITRLRLGLSPLNFHRFTYHLTPEPFCEHCRQVNESAEHFLLKCPYYAAPRTELFKILSDIGVNVHNDQEILNTILLGTNFSHNPDLIINPVITFLSVTNRFK